MQFGLAPMWAVTSTCHTCAVNKARDEAISHTSLCDISDSDDTGSFIIHSGAPALAGNIHAHGMHADDACGAECDLKAAICEHIGKGTNNKEVPADARSGDSVANKKAPCKAQCNRKAGDVVGMADNKVGKADAKVNRANAKVAGADSKAGVAEVSMNDATAGMADNRANTAQGCECNAIEGASTLRQGATKDCPCHHQK